jgi:type I restriction enzyme S subunit
MSNTVIARSEATKQSTWRECKLGEVAEVIGGGTPKTAINEYWNGNIPWLTPRDLTGYDKVYISHGERLITDEGLKNSSAKLMPKGTVLLTSRAPIGYVAIAENEICTNQGFKSLVPNFEILNSEFLYYWLKSNTDYLQQLGTGTTFAEISGSVVKDIDISLPPLEEQKAIAEVLSSLDDKIDLLHRQNQTLESLAQTLFRQWFIEEAKAEWEEKPLGEIAIVQNGYAFSSKDYVEFESEHLEVFKMGHIEPGGGLRFSPKADFVPREKKLEKWTLNEDDIVIAMTDMKDSMGILGHPAMIDKSDKYVLNQRVARIYLENQDNLLNNYLLYLQLSSQEAIDSLQSLANGGVQVNLSTEAIKSVSIIIPSKKFQIEKVNIFNEHLQKMKNNRQQIQTLENLRDTLLPKLLSGEVRVSI